MSSTSTPTSTVAHTVSAVNTTKPVASPRARHARSASPSPDLRVGFHRRAADTLQQTAVAVRALDELDEDCSLAILRLTTSTRIGRSDSASSSRSARRCARLDAQRPFSSSCAKDRRCRRAGAAEDSAPPFRLLEPRPDRVERHVGQIFLSAEVGEGEPQRGRRMEPIDIAAQTL